MEQYIRMAMSTHIDSLVMGRFDCVARKLQRVLLDRGNVVSIRVTRPGGVTVPGRLAAAQVHMGVSQNSVPHKRAERYRPPPSILVVFHTFWSVTPMTHTF